MRTADNALNITPTGTTDSIFWVRMAESDGSFTEGVLISIRVQPATCPYKGADLVAGTCKLRTEGARNWVAQVADGRDGQTYPIVLMPDGQWWLARNLSYMDGLNKAVNAGQPSTIQSGNWDVYKGWYWCPNESSNTLSGTDAECVKWGVLYPWQTLMSEDGIGTTNAATEAIPSTVRGVCPMGWHVPSAPEMWRMMDCVEGNCETNVYSAAPANWVGAVAGNHLRSNSTFNIYTGIPSHDSYGFTAQAAGYRNNTYVGGALRTDAYYWLASNRDINEASVAVFNYSRTGAYSARNHNKYHGFAVRCVSDGVAGYPPVTTAPAEIQSSMIISGTDAAGNNGANVTLTAVGGMVENGATYEWGTGTSVGVGVIAGATGESITRQVNATSNSYWVRRVSPTTGATAGVTTTIPTQPCLYTGAGLEAGTCGLSAENNRWEAAIRDTRALGNNQVYPIAQVGTDNRWWTMRALRYGTCAPVTGSDLDASFGAGARCIECNDGKNGIYFYNNVAFHTGAAFADNTTTQGICPAGWHLPGYTEVQQQLTSVSGAAFGVNEQNVCSYANTSAIRCMGNTNMHYYLSTGRIFYWSSGINLYIEAGVSARSESFAVRCVYGGGVNSSVSPSYIMGPDLLLSGRTARLEAIGATVVAGGVYQWSSTPDFSAILASGAAASVYTTPALNANATYYVRIMDSNGVPTGTKSIAITIAACPYTGSDLVAGSCTNRATGWQNFTASVWSGGAAARANDRAQYPIVRMPNGQWWFARNLEWTGAAAGTVGYWYQQDAKASATRHATYNQRYYDVQELGGSNSDPYTETQGPCPDGWHVASYNDWVYNLTVFPNTEQGRRGIACPNDDGYSQHFSDGTAATDTYGFCLQSDGGGYWDNAWRLETTGVYLHFWTSGSYHRRGKNAANGWDNHVSGNRSQRTPVRCVR
jgi:uncharacterized protein (TIGR02145 family)